MAGFSLARKSDSDASEYRDYLNSLAWWMRRARWFVEAQASGETTDCLVCESDTVGEVDLHHVKYSPSLRNAEGQFEATEEHDWLIPLSRDCHEALHKHLDEYSMDYFGVSRFTATAMVLARLRQKKTRKTT